MLPMNSFILPLLMGAQPPAGADAATGGSSLVSMLMTFLPIIAIFYFLIIRPQNKKRKETEKMLSALKKGDKVVTIGGLHGTIQSVKETTVILKADDNVKLEFLRSAISNIAQQSASKDKEIEDKEEKTEGQASENGE
jgi:preprotein translocase subunit YajC